MAGPPESTARAARWNRDIREGELEERHLALSQADFERLVDDHGPVLYRLAYRLVGDWHEAEDCVQDALRSAWKSRQTFQHGRGQRAWLAAILRRRVIDRWRRRPQPSVLANDSVIDLCVEPDDPWADSFEDETQRALDLLPPELRDSLLLVVVGELTHQEAADQLGVPLGTVLSRVSRARRRLRQFLIVTTSG